MQVLKIKYRARYHKLNKSIYLNLKIKTMRMVKLLTTVLFCVIFNISLV